MHIIFYSISMKKKLYVATPCHISDTVSTLLSFLKRTPLMLPSLWRGIVGEAFSQLHMLYFHLLMQENLSRFLKAFGVLGRQVSA